jgi:hypothetical protein
VSKQVTPVTTKSPNMVSSRRVPDLHGRILAKIRAGKARGGARRGAVAREEPAPGSPVGGKEVQQYLGSVFSICDTYGSGSVRAGVLLEYLARYRLNKPTISRSVFG